jgi:hypothetical protein
MCGHLLGPLNNRLSGQGAPAQVALAPGNGPAPAISAAQQAPRIDIAVDAAPLAARRMLQQMLAQERE